MGRRKATMNTETQSPHPVGSSAWLDPLRDQVRAELERERARNIDAQVNGTGGKYLAELRAENEKLRVVADNFCALILVRSSDSTQFEKDLLHIYNQLPHVKERNKQ